MWEGSSGAIVTTDGQAEALLSLFLISKSLFGRTASRPLCRPHQRPSLCRPLPVVNSGSSTMATSMLHASSGTSENSRRAAGGSGPSCTNMAISSGTVCCRESAMRSKIERRQVLPWSQILAEAPAFHAALAIGNRNPAQLPSKAVQYLTLPIPRVALVGTETDALATYARGMPGWVSIAPTTSHPDRELASLLGRHWNPSELAPPVTESWEHVERALLDFIVTATGIKPSIGTSPEPLTCTAEG